MKNWPSEDKYYNLWWEIDLMWHAMYKARKKDLSKYGYGFTPTVSAVLHIISTTGSKATISEISRWESREPHSTSELITRMERSGLVRRDKCSKGSKKIRIVMTEKGREAYNKSKKRTSIQRIIASSLSDEECQKMKIMVEKIWAGALTELGTLRRHEIPPFQILKKAILEHGD